MVKHIILWQFSDGLSDEQKKKAANEAKSGLEALSGRINGLVDIKVVTDGLMSSNADMMLDSTFTDEAALRSYSVHPEHVAVADTRVRPFIKTRVCMDYEIK